MKIKISNELNQLYKKTGKNINYMLDYYLASIDSKNCRKYYEIFEAMSIKGEKEEIEISEENIKYVYNIFGNNEDKLIELLLCNAIFLNEV